MYLVQLRVGLRVSQSELIQTSVDGMRESLHGQKHEDDFEVEKPYIQNT